MLMTSFIEGSPNVVKEAMACNLPVVSVVVGDTQELLSRVQGYRICPRNAEALAEALVDVLAHPPEAQGRSALKHKGLDQESVARQIRQLYTMVLERSVLTSHDSSSMRGGA
ncbi:MAG: glycosyltransferase, partial [Candidatus Tectomicrobia bacterium]|nr:glycosyltransferase [Candidatus Tectomicrobia bacterium]